MSCVDRDQALALLAHGELHGLAGIRLRLHLRSCLRCRERLQAFTATSTTLHAFLNAGPDSYSPNPDFFGRTYFQLVRTLVLAVLALVVLTGAGWLLGHWIPAGSGARVTVPARTDVPCDPSLPNDHCH